MKPTLRLAFLLVLVALAAPSPAAAIFFGVTATSEPRLVAFDPATPGVLLSAPRVSGLEAGETVRGMDLRPLTGGLVLLTTDAGGAARLRTLDAGTGQVGPPLVLVADPTDSTAPFTTLDTTTAGIGVDVNPTADRLRVVTGSGQNLRVNPNNGAVTTDGTINPGSPVVAGAAYVNSFPGATTTTLYDIDAGSSSLFIQTPPNNGTLVLVGALGVTPETVADLSFDISPAGNAGFLIARTSGATRLFTVNLTTGAVTLVGNVGDGATPIRGFTVARNVVRPTASLVEQREGGGSVTVTVERLSPHLGVRVDYATVDGTGRAGIDYLARSGTLVFADGETTKTISVPLVDDAAVDASKTFTVALSALTPDLGTTATLPGPASTTVSVVDDDTTPPDRDRDGVPDATDTCPNVADPGQADADRDGIGTACDISEMGPDSTKPVLLATAADTRRSRLRTTGVRVRFSCNEACAVSGRLVAGTKTAARGTARQLTKAGVGTLALKVSRSGLRSVGKRKRLKIVLTGRDAAGNRSTFTLFVRIR